MGESGCVPAIVPQDGAGSTEAPHADARCNGFNAWAQFTKNATRGHR